MNSIIDKQSLIDSLAEEIVSTNVTPELANQANKLVMGDGDLSAKIVFIGEAPGKKEDETGLPFMGAAGKFLNQMLESVNLDRSSVYITNIVKYRPPDNRDPKPSEKKAFLPFLLRQLDIINPQIIVTLGRHSMEYFLPNAKIGELHGQVFDVKIDGKAYKVAPLYHPAAALYNGSLRQTLMDDFAQVKSQLN